MRRHRGEVRHSFYGGGREAEQKPCEFWTGGPVLVQTHQSENANALKIMNVKVFIHKYEC